MIDTRSGTRGAVGDWVAALAEVWQAPRERLNRLMVLLGMISERDIVHAFAADRERAADVEVAEVMTRDIVTYDPDESLTKILGLMTRHRVRHIPVMQSSQLVGLISIGDVVKHRLDELEMEAAVLRDSYIAGH